jgi:YtoQ family protein|tara:strand:- start:581 stop:1030 length:450 start_codon:yes stop_codon:yes gene_type:complete
MKENYWTIYLSGEIHSNWRDEIVNGSAERDLPIQFTFPETDHGASDAAGDLLGQEEKNFWRDHKSSKVNSLRTKTLIEKSDLVIIKFGEQYKQWNAAFDAGFCAALGTPYITLHGEDIVHPLKEVDSSASAWATSTAQVIAILAYVTRS